MIAQGGAFVNHAPPRATAIKLKLPMSARFIPLALIALTLALLKVHSAPVVLKEIASFPREQVTGIAVSTTGRIFVNFPYWADEHGVSVAELKDDQPVPYPDPAWNKNEGDPATRFVCVQSVVADDAGALWVLDPASPHLAGTVKGGPKLVKIDLATNRPVETYFFDEATAPEHSYLNDVRIDTRTQHAYITESGLGALIVVDLRTKKMRRLLTKHPSTQAEAGTDLVVDGIRLVDPQTQTTPAMHADGIALDQVGGWLYYRPLTGHNIYRIKTSDLLDEKLSDDDLGRRVAKIGESAATDGMLESKSGRIYCAAFEKDAIQRLDPVSHFLETVIQDPSLQWPDTLSWGPDGSLYITCSQIHRMPKYNGGVSKQQGPFKVFRLEGLGGE